MVCRGTALLTLLLYTEQARGSQASAFRCVLYNSRALSSFLMKSSYLIRKHALLMLTEFDSTVAVRQVQLSESRSRGCFADERLE
jgi:hypothetical protein